MENSLGVREWEIGHPAMPQYAGSFTRRPCVFSAMKVSRGALRRGHMMKMPGLPTRAATLDVDVGGR
jgi:hypothetical protein